MKQRILVIDESASVRNFFKTVLSDKYHVIVSDFKEETFILVKSEDISLIILGIIQPIYKKMTFLRRLLLINKTLAILLVGDEHIKDEISKIMDYELMDFLTKPGSAYELTKKVERLLLRRDILRSGISKEKESKELIKYLKIYESPILGDPIKQQIRVALDNNLPVLITGEKGVGKEITAKIIHWNGPHKGGKWIKINCSNINSLPEIFTEKTKVEHGTVYLEQIERLDTKWQIVLREFIEEGLNNNIRVIAATSVNLQEKKEKEEFDSHLFYQLSIIPIHLLPLRERKEDIPAIADYFLKEVRQKANIRAKEFSLDALEVLQNYWWPGNLTELKSVVVRSAIFSKEEEISGSQLLFSPKVFLSHKKPWKSEDILSVETLAVKLAHKIKNPLVAIKTFAQLLPEMYEDNGFRNQFYQVVNESADRINYLVERILKYGEMTSPNATITELQPILHRLLGELEDVEVQKEFAHLSDRVWIDQEHFSFIFDGIIKSITSSLPKNSPLIIRTHDFEPDEEEKKTFADLGFPSKKGIRLEISYPRVTNEIDLELIIAKRAMARLGSMKIKKSEQENTIVIKLPGIQT